MFRNTCSMLLKGKSIYFPIMNQNAFHEFEIYIYTFCMFIEGKTFWNIEVMSFIGNVSWLKPFKTI